MHNIGHIFDLRLQWSNVPMYVWLNSPLHPNRIGVKYYYLDILGGGGKLSYVSVFPYLLVFFNIKLNKSICQDCQTWIFVFLNAELLW